MKNNEHKLSIILDRIDAMAYDYLTEESFCTQSDDRVWTSYVEDIEGGDNFADYCEYIFNLLEEEGYYE